MPKTFNKVAAVKAVSLYLSVVVTVVGWVWLAIWALLTEQNEFVTAIALFAPFVLFLAVVVFILVVFVPIVSIYDSLNRPRRR